MSNKYFKSLNFKLLSLVFMGIIPMVLGMFFYVLPVFEENLFAQRKEEVRTGVSIVIGMLDKIQNEVKAGVMTQEQANKEIQKTFAILRYNKTDYFFAYDSKGYNTAHGTKPDFVGTPRADSKDPDGKYYVKEFLTYIGKEEGGFVGYKFEKTKGTPPIPKISYIQYYKPLNWIVGSGVYIDVVEAQVNAIRMKIIAGILFITAAAFAFSWYYSNRLCNQINKISTDLFNEADKVADVAMNISKASESLSSSTTQQASALQETSSSIEETSAMISKNAENAKTSMVVSTKSQVSVEEGKKFVTEMITSIQDIADSNVEMVKQIDQSNKEIADIVKVINEIGDKTKVINDIVFQTKLLSFNASVEAARAGEHGKGFAVVAEEIGNLAQMSGNSAKEISDLLGNSIQTVQKTIDNSKSRITKIVANGDSKIKHGGDIARRCGEVFDEIVLNVNHVNEMVGEISVASNEQATGVKEITAAVAELDTTGQQNTMLSQQTSDYAEQLRSQVNALKKNTNALDFMLKGVDEDNKAA
ncbi:methyl-accepting chemotaxis protein [Bacteriovorax sp. PP10]|uniref:Methyl-accepting chemotaxis protein n=1 Tax=Bacteriovorax antarcticus TaxID=3088717 RepID=A0ABU5VW71_9BACT|nr:methyl-accepting chemotaxis protein [Bacteriovorax sp. PP10]MEA9356837.1 methyl-accepting chemotaxis protein [Bacteriovorax sp. PP10]